MEEKKSSETGGPDSNAITSLTQNSVNKEEAVIFKETLPRFVRDFLHRVNAMKFMSPGNVLSVAVAKNKIGEAFDDLTKNFNERRFGLTDLEFECSLEEWKALGESLEKWGIRPDEEGKIKYIKTVKGRVPSRLYAERHELFWREEVNWAAYKEILEPIWNDVLSWLQQVGPKEKVYDVYVWANNLTTESKEFRLEDYYWPEEIRALLLKLRNLRRGLYGVIGLQGTGKSAAMKAMASALSKEFEEWGLTDQYVVDFKWMDPQTKLYDELSKYEKYRYKMGEGTQKFLSDAHTIFIDMPDYSKSDARRMTTGLGEVQRVWNNLQILGSNANFIVMIQKEMFRGHFFFGKMSVVELKTFKPQQLVEAYKHRFNETFPFTDEELLYLARLSRGVFRRFLHYIQLALEKWLSLKPQSLEEGIDKETVKSAIGPEQLLIDMDLELSEIFRKGDLKGKAIAILNLLAQEEEGLNQKQLADHLDMNEMAVSRVLDRLETYGYVKRERLGPEKIVKMNW